MCASGRGRGDERNLLCQVRAARLLFRGFQHWTTAMNPPLTFLAPGSSCPAREGCVSLDSRMGYGHLTLSRNGSILLSGLGSIWRDCQEHSSRTIPLWAQIICPFCGHRYGHRLAYVSGSLAVTSRRIIACKTEAGGRRQPSMSSRSGADVYLEGVRRRPEEFYKQGLVRGRIVGGRIGG